MSLAKRKIGFYSINVTDDANNQINPQIIMEVINYIVSLDKTNRVYDLLNKNKFHLLDYASIDPDLHKLIFKSSKYNHRPPLIDKATADERDNPKSLSEGESEKTHVVLKYLDDEIILIKEDRVHGININMIVYYLHRFFKLMDKNAAKKCDIKFAVIPKEDFLKELNALSRVTVGEAYIERQVLGSECLNFAQRTEEVQELIQLTLKAKRGTSIKDALIEVYNKFVGTSSVIKKIRVYGFNEIGDGILLDTDIIKRIEYVTTEIDEITGIVDSDSLLTNLALIVSNL